MDGHSASLSPGWPEPSAHARRWTRHAAQALLGPHHELTPAPHQTPRPSRNVPERPLGQKIITLDGSLGEGGGQILRSALSLSLLTGKPFRIVKIRANRDKPGLRPQHLTAVDAAASLCGAVVSGLSVGSRELVFRPEPYEPQDLSIDIGTAGSTALVLQTLYLPIALKASKPVRVVLIGGTFNDHAPSFPFLQTTWRAHLARMGLSLGLSMPSAGFYPQGGGRLEAWIEPAQLSPLAIPERGPLRRIVGKAGVLNLSRGSIPERLRDQALLHLRQRGLDADIELVSWTGRGQGAALALSAEFEDEIVPPPTFVALGARGKPAETVADEAVLELLDHLDHPGSVDLHSADQILLPLALADGPSAYSVTHLTEHLRTNVRTLRAFLDRDIRLEEPSDTHPARVLID